jgi:hypothetical protein
MIETSADTAKLDAALAKAQGEIEPPARTRPTRRLRAAMPISPRSGVPVALLSPSMRFR